MFHDIGERKMEFNVFIGFDGFIDTILKPIKSKTMETVVAFQAMQEFADYIGKKSGKSCSIALEMMQEKIGGNMPIVANALGNLGCRAVCVGAMGVPEILPMFQKMSKNCSLISVANPGYCNSLEFEDGKLMLATNTSIDNLNYKKLTSYLPEKKLTEYIEKCDAAAFLNWGELLCSNDIWENILVRIIPNCNFTEKKIMLVDFSDFSKRSDFEVIKMLELLHGYSKYFDITVSLNENELDLFLNKLQITNADASFEERIVELSERFSCNNFVIHFLESSCYVKDQMVHFIKKEVIKEPKIITGGGDNFNAGLLAGLLLGAGIEEAIEAGSALSCLYVQKGREVQLDELLNYEC